MVLFFIWVMLPPRSEPVEFPDGRTFGFTIVDDTDQSTLRNVEPVYELLEELGFRTTKTVWTLPSDTFDLNFGESMRDPEYRDFVLGLRDDGFEIATHGSRGGSSRREEIFPAMDELTEVVGYRPRMHINHAANRDNVYWGPAKLTFGPYRWLYLATPKKTPYEGHIEGGDWFWGDYVQDNVDYVVNFSFRDINLLNVNPKIPYHIPSKPYVNYWFHSSDAADINSFLDLLSPENLDQLEREGGVSIVYTHFGFGFVQNGQLHPQLRERLTDLASRPGWFVPASEMLDHLKDQGRGGELTLRETIRLETIWLWERVTSAIAS